MTEPLFLWKNVLGLNERLLTQHLEAKMKRQILRLAVMAATATGLVALISTAAEARLTANHSEPLR